MNIEDFNFDLPEELIAQTPLKDRSASRLLVLNKETKEIAHKQFMNVIDYLRSNDCLVLNDTRVIPARLYRSEERRVGKGCELRRAGHQRLRQDVRGQIDI